MVSALPTLAAVHQSFLTRALGLSATDDHSEEKCLQLEIKR